MRVAIDTDVIVAALRSHRGASRVILESALEKRFVMLASVPLMIEYEAVLKRAENLSAFGISAFDVDVLLDTLASIVEPIRLAFLWRPKLRDPNDEMVLETALNGSADMLITFNQRHLRRAAAEFGLLTATPGEALTILRRRNAAAK